MLFLFNLGCVKFILVEPHHTLTFSRYAATWGTVAFLIPTEIFPSNLRAQGNGFGITGWAIGVGMTTLVNPIMFGSLEVSMEMWSHVEILTRPRAGVTSFLPVSICSGFPSSIYVCFPCWTIELRLTSLIVYPETRNRSLESIDALFSTASPFHWKMEQAYSLRGDVLAEHGVTNQTYQAGKTESSCDRSEVQPAIV